MDDLCKAVSKIDKAIRFTSDLTRVFSLGGFNLTKRTSNSKQFLESVEEERLGDKKQPLERVLGVKRKPESGQYLVEAKRFQTLWQADITQKFAFSLFDQLEIAMPLKIRLPQLIFRVDLRASMRQRPRSDNFVRPQRLYRQNRRLRRGTKSNVLLSTNENNRHSAAIIQQCL